MAKDVSTCLFGWDFQSNMQKRTSALPAAPGTGTGTGTGAVSRSSVLAPLRARGCRRVARYSLRSQVATAFLTWSFD